jgi:acyl carrier protein
MGALDELKSILAGATKCSEQDISPDTALKDLKVDSLRWIQIIVAVESTFDIEVDIDRMREFVTVDDFLKHIEALMK